MELDISDASIAGGYVPQEGDQVIASYEKGDMKLLHLQLEYRPAPEPVVEEEQAGDDGYDDGDYDDESYEEE